MKRMKRRTLWTTVTAMAVVFALMLSSIAVISADTAGSGGEVLTFADGGVKVDVPQGALSADVDITYTALSGDAVPGLAPAGTALGSNVFSLAVTPATTFKRAVGVTITYNAADVTAGDGNYTNVKLYAYDAGFKEWQSIESAIRDIPGLTLTTQQTIVAGTYAIIVTGAPAPPPVATPTPAPTPAPTPPKTGDMAPSASLLLGLAAAGLLLVLGGGYLFVRHPGGSRA